MAQKANFAAWDPVQRLTIASAARLWAEQEPEPGNVVSSPGHAYSIHKYLKNRITELGVLGLGVKALGHHLVHRDVLRKIAEERGERPKFLFPEERSPVRRRSRGEPKPETVEGWKKDYEEIEHWCKTLGKVTIREAARQAAKGSERSGDAFATGHRRYKKYLKPKDAQQ